MKSIISKTLTLVALAGTLFSFTSKFGGEGFEIYLNGKVVLQQFGSNMDKIKTLKLPAEPSNNKLSIKYYHCGTTGKNKMLIIKDEQNNIVKEWRYKDASTNEMTLNVKDMISLKKGQDPVLKLYYSSSELPKGRQLANVLLENSKTAQP